MTSEMELAFASREALFDPNSKVDLLEDFWIAARSGKWSIYFCSSSRSWTAKWDSASKYCRYWSESYKWRQWRLYVIYVLTLSSAVFVYMTISWLWLQKASYLSKFSVKFLTFSFDTISLKFLLQILCRLGTNTPPINDQIYTLKSSLIFATDHMLPTTFFSIPLICRSKFENWLS